MSQWYYRHRLPVRLMHWITVAVFVVLLMSGLMIFNAHPTLYWGDQSYGGATKLLAIRGVNTDRGPVGMTTLFGRTFDTTGVLGAAANARGGVSLLAFPHWATIPSYYSLAAARRWHLTFVWLLVANGLIYVLWSIASRHLSDDLAPTTSELKSIGQSLKDHLHFRHPRGEAARRYNVLQKLAYLSVIFGAFPLLIVTGLAMSPALDALAPGWVDLLGGRQSARTLHFIAAFAMLAFMALHVLLVLTTGVWNNLRSMIDGRYRLRAELAVASAPLLPPIEYASPPAEPAEPPVQIADEVPPAPVDEPPSSDTEGPSRA